MCASLPIKGNETMVTMGGGGIVLITRLGDRSCDEIGRVRLFGSLKSLKNSSGMRNERKAVTRERDVCMGELKFLCI